MQSLQPIFMNGTAFNITELNLGQAIEIAKIPQNQHERKISAILTAILGGEIDPYELTLQERHYLLMQYVARHDESFGYGIDFSDFEKDALPSEAVEVNGYTFRHLNGYECEALEQYAKNYMDWVLGSIALQISGNDLMEILPAKDIKYALNLISSRVGQLYAMDLDTAEIIFNSYYEAMDSLNHLLDYGYDEFGVVVIGKPSFDTEGLRVDNSVRFCEATTIPATVRSVIESLVEKDTNAD